MSIIGAGEDSELDFWRTTWMASVPTGVFVLVSASGELADPSRSKWSDGLEMSSSSGSGSPAAREDAPTGELLTAWNIVGATNRNGE
jgi:hypothetical protein